MPAVNNDFYSDLGDRWFEGDDHAIDLLRREGKLKTAYVREVFDRYGIGEGAGVLDVACGAGLISIPLADAGYHVEGVDLAEGALAAARRRVPDGAVATFRTANALDLDAEDDSFDAVLLLDMLEHVDQPDRALAEAGRTRVQVPALQGNLSMLVHGDVDGKWASQALRTAIAATLGLADVAVSVDVQSGGADQFGRIAYVIRQRTREGVAKVNNLTALLGVAWLDEVSAALATMGWKVEMVEQVPPAEAEATVKVLVDADHASDEET